jgi:glycosyltransferase involved in cell wall biosynthesis
LSVSIVIPTTMQRETVAPVTEAAVAAVSPMEGGEVILVANGPTDGRRPLDFRSPRLRVIECPVPRQSAARNVGLSEARNDSVLFTDDDCLMTPEWPAVLAERLRTGDAAVATRVDTRHRGPVTAFLDYQRIFHARPLDASTVEYALGASVGVRRDLIPTRFADDMGPGDDVQFGTSIRDAGFSIAYVREAPALIHVLPEELKTITARFVRYGTSNANLFLAKNRPEFSAPHATSLYSSLCRNGLAAPRRFEEISDPVVRELFATYELILLGCFLVGYLGRAGEILGREILRIDQEALAGGWLEIERRLDQALPPERDWQLLPLDLERWFTPLQGRRPALAAEVSENLRRNARLAEEARDEPELDVWAGQGARRADGVWHRANEIWLDLQEGRLDAEVEQVASRLRSAGIAFREGGQMIETIAQGALEPAVAGP